jgi:CPA2 family monovalent cation:H+ antiporter-2
LHSTGFLSELLLLIAIAAVGVALFERVRLPSIAGFLVMGVLVGPGGVGFVEDPERVRDLAELGVVFLLFEIGLELPLERLRRLWRRAIAAGGLQVAATLVCVTVLGRAFSLSTAESLVMGALVAMSSTALVMRLLSERGEIDTPQGQISVGVLLFQDFCIVPFLLAVPILAVGGSAWSTEIPLEIARALAALLIFFAAARFLLPAALDRVARFGSRELFTIVAFLVVLGSAVVAEAVGLTLAVGAFVGGLVLSASPYSHQVFAEVAPLRGVLLGVFFTAIGMLLSPVEAVEQWPAVLAYISGVVVLKAGIIAAVTAFVLRQGVRVGVLTGLALAQTGEFSFVLAAVALDARLLEPWLYQTFVAGSVGTLLATPFLLALAPRLASFVVRRADRPSAVVDAEGGLSNHVVLIGFGFANRTVARVLSAREIPYTVVEANPRTVQEVVEPRQPLIYGDATRRLILERAGATRARLVSVAISDPVATREVVALLRSLNDRVSIVVRTRYVLEVDRLYAAGASVVVAEEFESTIEILSETLRAFGVPEGAIGRFAGELREEAYEPIRDTPTLGIDPWLSELLDQVSTEWIEVPEEFEGQASLIELRVREETGSSVLAVDRGGVTSPNPPPSHTIQAGDRLLVFGSASAVSRLRESLGSGVGRGG